MRGRLYQRLLLQQDFYVKTSGCTKAYKNFGNSVDSVNIAWYDFKKLNRLDRGAKFISTAPASSGSRRCEKGDFAEVPGNACFPRCWVVGKYPPDCHKIL